MFEKLQAELEEARGAYDAIVAEQAPLRARVAKVTASLNAKLSPMEQKLARADEALQEAKTRAIGPWRIDREGRRWAGFLDVYGTAGEWYHNRVWLRMPTYSNAAHPSGERRWEAQIDLLTVPGNITLDLGPPSKNPEADWARVSAATEAKCKEMGYIVVPGELR